MLTEMKHKAFFGLVTCLALAASSTTLANTPGTWQVAVGVHNVDPKSNNGPLKDGTPVDVDSAVVPTLTVEYFFSNNMSVELLGAIPGKHDISSRGTKIGEAKPVAPVLSLQYYFADMGKIQPFASAGFNYTSFYDESSVLGDAKLDDSFGFALRLGADYSISQNGKIRADLRWIDVDSDVSINGVNVGEVEIDPLVYGLAYAWSF